MLTVDMVRAGARRHGDRVAIRYGERSLTFRQVDEAANRMANVFLGMGVEPGERIGLLLGNGLWTVPLDFACLKARACRVPLNARLSLEEHARMLADSRRTRWCTSPRWPSAPHELGERLDGLRTLGLDDLLEQTHAASAADPRLPARPEDVILALYTSGTTGTLKAAQHTQASYAAIVVNIMANLISPAPDDVMLHAAPLIHASGTFVLPFWLRGAQATVLDGFDPQGYLAAIPRYGVTHANLVPTMLQMLLAAAWRHRRDRPPALGDLRCLADAAPGDRGGDGGLGADLQPVLRADRGTAVPVGAARRRPRRTGRAARLVRAPVGGRGDPADRRARRGRRGR